MSNSLSIPLSLTDSLGRYVLAIYELSVNNRVARSKDIAEAVGVSRPSVTGALQKLAKAGLIEYEPYGYVVLTEEGITEARQLLLKHRATSDFLSTVLGISAERSDAVAAEIEQHLPSDVLCRLIQFNRFYRESSETSFRWSATCNHVCQLMYGVHGNGHGCDSSVHDTIRA